MLKEFIESIAKQAVAAAGPQLREVSPRSVSYAVKKDDGSVEIIDAQPTFRGHTAEDLETVVAFAHRFDSASIWYSREEIVCLIDDDDRRDSVRIAMIRSDQILKLETLDDMKPHITHRDLLMMLRTVFTPASLAKAPKLIDTLRQVKFQAGQVADANIQRGKSSVGKSIATEATFIDTLPETVTLSVPIFDNAFARRPQDVVCALEVHEAEQNFQLFPLPGEVEKAFALAEADIAAAIREMLGADNLTPVYHGAP